MEVVSQIKAVANENNPIHGNSIKYNLFHFFLSS